MPNTTLITTAETINLVADGGISNEYSGAGGAKAFVIANGNVGDDSIINFGADDSIITGKKIFDGNGDGYIAFGSNNTLDVDRTSSRNPGEDNISVQGTGGSADNVSVIRYLGTKEGKFVYADAGTRDALLGHFTSGFSSTNGGGDSSITQTTRIDNDVSDNTFAFGAGSVALLTDNALGLNFGGDTITGFGDDDLLVFTSQILDRTGENIITFGKNLVLDLSGADGPLNSDPNGGPGGQFDFAGKTQIFYLGEKTIDGTSYYYYGASADQTADGVSFGA